MVVVGALDEAGAVVRVGEDALPRAGEHAQRRRGPEQQQGEERRHAIHLGSKVSHTRLRLRRPHSTSIWRTISFLPYLVMGVTKMVLWRGRCGASCCLLWGYFPIISCVYASDKYVNSLYEVELTGINEKDLDAIRTSAFESSPARILWKKIYFLLYWKHLYANSDKGTLFFISWGIPLNIFVCGKCPNYKWTWSMMLQVRNSRKKQMTTSSWEMI